MGASTATNTDVGGFTTAVENKPWLFGATARIDDRAWLFGLGGRGGPAFAASEGRGQLAGSTSKSHGPERGAGGPLLLKTIRSIRGKTRRWMSVRSREKHRLS